MNRNVRARIRMTERERETCTKFYNSADIFGRTATEFIY